MHTISIKYSSSNKLKTFNYAVHYKKEGKSTQSISLFKFWSYNRNDITLFYVILALYTKTQKCTKKQKQSLEY